MFRRLMGIGMAGARHQFDQGAASQRQIQESTLVMDMAAEEEVGTVLELPAQLVAIRQPSRGMVEDRA